MFTLGASNVKITNCTILNNHALPSGFDYTNNAKEIAVEDDSNIEILNSLV